MKPGTIKRLVLVLLMLAGFTVIFRVVAGKSPKKLAFSHVTPQSTTKIEINSVQAQVVLEKKNNIWMITSPIAFRANPDYISELLNGIKKISLKTVISTNPGKFEKFQVSDSSAAVVTVHTAGDKPPVSVMVGKQSTQNYSNLYVRLKGKPEVYDTEGPRLSFLKTSPEEWRDKTIISEKKAEVTEIDIISRKETVKLFRKGKEWLLDDPEKGSPANEPEINTILDTLEKLTATDIITPEQQAQQKLKTGLDKPEFELLVKTTGSYQVRLTFGSVKANGKYYVKREGDDNLFQAYEYQVNNLRKEYSRLKKPETSPQAVPVTENK